MMGGTPALRNPTLRWADEGARPYGCSGREFYQDWLTRLTIIVTALWAANAAPSCQPMM